MRVCVCLAACLTLLLLSTSPAHAEGLNDDEMVQILETLDDRQRNSGDYKALLYIEQREKDKDDLQSIRVDHGG